VSVSTPTPLPKPEQTAQVKTAKLFKNGRSQAVRLPKEFRFEGTEVVIRKDAATGNVILVSSQQLAPPATTLQQLFNMLNAQKITLEDFESEVKKLGKLSTEELTQLCDWAQIPPDYFQREAHIPRELDLF